LKIRFSCLLYLSGETIKNVGDLSMEKNVDASVSFLKIRFEKFPRCI